MNRNQTPKCADRQRREYQKEYRRKNLERLKEYDAAYKQKNRDKINEYARQYRTEHPEKYESTRINANQHGDQLSAQARLYGDRAGGRKA